MAKVTFDVLFDQFRNASQDRREAAYRILTCGLAREKSPVSGDERFLTLKDAAATLGFHPVTLYRWRVPGHQIGGRRRFLLSEVRAFLLGRSVGQAAP